MNNPALSERIAELERITRTMTPRDAVPILMAHIAGEPERIARAVAERQAELDGANDALIEARKTLVDCGFADLPFLDDGIRAAVHLSAVMERDACACLADELDANATDVAAAIRARGSRT